MLTLLLILSIITNLSDACVATATPTTATTATTATTRTTTTTVACCPVLTTTSLPRMAPSGSGFQQCSVLKRVSSSCPRNGLVMCDAAQETNPTNVVIQFFNSAGTVVRTFTEEGDSVAATVTCVNGAWEVENTAGTGYVAIASVSCSQTGSTGADHGTVIKEV